MSSMHGIDIRSTYSTQTWLELSQIQLVIPWGFLMTEYLSSLPFPWIAFVLYRKYVLSRNLIGSASSLLMVCYSLSAFHMSHLQ